MESTGKEDGCCKKSCEGGYGVHGYGLFESEEEEFRGQAEIWKHTFAFVDSLAVKCAVLLGIPDMIAGEGPLTVGQIAARLRLHAAKSLEFNGSDIDVGCLFRILRFLVAKNVFSAAKCIDSNGESETIYGLTAVSKWLVKDGMSSMLLMQNHQTNAAAWHLFNECILSGGSAFQRANGTDIWSYASSHPDYNELFNQAMAWNAKIVMRVVLAKYGHGFQNLRSLVDVGGGTGTAVGEIVRAFPGIRAINLDLPRVVATAPQRPGVAHIAGDMFVSVPSAESVFMKSVMHDWNDEECIKILKNCRKAIPEWGKMIMVEIVIKEESEEKEEEEKEMMSELGLVFDLVMIAHTAAGKERTEAEWRKILCGGGFGRYNIIKIPALQSIIEAFPS